MDSSEDEASPQEPGADVPRSEIIDVTDRDVSDGAPRLRPNDRVERHSRSSERSRWGTITGPSNDGDSDWLVVDNDGVTHRDRAADLSVAKRKANRPFS